MRLQKSEKKRFQSTFPRRERPNTTAAQGDFASFNPRSREGNDADVWAVRTARKTVSIHVPAKGTTHLFLLHFLFWGVSIHVPAKGTTTLPCSPSCIRQFQSTFPRRERRGCLGRENSQKNGFNPRSREGNDYGTTASVCILSAFQSTFPRRERLKGAGFEGNYYMFQSTFPRRERRNCFCVGIDIHAVSIHVPAKGTTAITYNFYL